MKKLWKVEIYLRTVPACDKEIRLHLTSASCMMNYIVSTMCLFKHQTVYKDVQMISQLGTQYHNELRVNVEGSCQLHCASRGLLNLPRYNMTKYGQHSFSCAGPRAWNLLPEHL